MNMRLTRKRGEHVAWLPGGDIVLQHCAERIIGVVLLNGATRGSDAESTNRALSLQAYDEVTSGVVKLARERLVKQKDIDAAAAQAAQRGFDGCRHVRSRDAGQRGQQEATSRRVLGGRPAKSIA